MTDGEDWARTALRELRERRFAPRACADFVAASGRRAGDIRRARPALARRARRWELGGAAAWGALALAHREPFRRRAASGLAWWALVSVMLEWHLGMVESEDGAARNLGAADALTLARAFVVPVIAEDLSTTTLALAAASDVLDGIVARATVPTRAGRDLEGLVDVALLAAGLRCALRTGALGRRVAALELGRVALGTGYGVAAYFARAAPPSPTVIRAARLTTPLRLGGLVAAGRGRRDTADALMAAGSLSGLVLLALALAVGSEPAAES